MSKTVRTFIAIELSQEIKDALEYIENNLRTKISGVKWVRPENIHLTLKFLGHVRIDTLESVKIVLTETAKNAKPFTIRLSSPGAFPSVNGPRVIWIGIDKGNKESVDMANFIEEKTAVLGIEKENRAFHPHLTLARVNFLKDKYLLKNAFSSLKIPPVEMAASKLTLFQSTLTREGSIYTVLHAASF